nr:hypothetical protein [Chroococcidiopsis cubana]
MQAGGTWVELRSPSIFPLLPGNDYSNISFPSLVVSRRELISVFQPFLESLK